VKKLNKNEAIELVIGGIGGASFDIGMETVWASDKAYWTGKFPFIPLLGDKIPPLDDWLVLGVPTIIALVAHKTNHPTARNVALGGAIYGLGMLLRHTIIRWSPYQYLSRKPISLTVPLIKEI